jgi:hypothetical protein
VVSHVARAVALLAQAVDAGGHAQAACATADEHARVMRDTYTSIAEDSGHDAPNAATRHILDAQEALTEVTNRLHDAAEALRTYSERIAPDLAGTLRHDSVHRPTGAELVEMGTQDPGRSRRLQFARSATRRRDDVSDATQRLVDNNVEAYRSFQRLPDPPSAVRTEARQPTEMPIPMWQSVHHHTSYGGLGDAAWTVGVLAFGAKEFGRRVRQGLKRPRRFGRGKRRSS